MTDTGHDSAGIAAKFLADDTPAEERRAIEAHMMSCDTCWAEMITARAGRTLAEGLRESAPQSTRETLRSIASSPPPDAVAQGQPARWRWLQSGFNNGRHLAAAALVVVVAAALTGVVALLTARPPEGPLQAAAAEYQVASGRVPGTGERPPAERIGGLVWTETTHKAIGGQPATLYRYADAQGQRVVLISSTESFPRADNAQDVGSGPEWIADVDGATLLCADSGGLSWLVVAGSKDAALVAGDAAGLTP